MRTMGKSIHENDLVPQDFSYNNLLDQTKEIRADKSITVCQEDRDVISKLNEKQRIAFETIIDKVQANKGCAFFVDGPRGTGKTFLYRALLAKIRSEGHTALAIATSICRVSKQTSLASLIKDCKLIIWDEAPMENRVAVEALNDLLQDLTDSTELFWG
ncbi:ATP-dependent DNA helicase RRM3-like protein [Tanacetum coccineum]